MLCGISNFRGENFLLVDIPGTYSILSNSEEEEIARDYICFNEPDVTVIILDATCLERNLNLVFQVMEITSKVVVCVNLLDEAKKCNININLKKLEQLLGVPVVGTIARKPKTLFNLMKAIQDVCHNTILPTPNIITYSESIEKSIEEISNQIATLLPPTKKELSRWISLKILDYDEKIISSIEKNLSISFSIFSKKTDEKIRDEIVSTIIKHSEKIGALVCKSNFLDRNRTQKLDKILTSKLFGIPIMLLFLGVLFWITIVGANYPSTFLSNIFSEIKGYLLGILTFLHSPSWLNNLLLDGVYTTVTWVIAVMLPPMAIFFPLFTLLEDSGYLPRIAFNLDKYFKKACTSR